MKSRSDNVLDPISGDDVPKIDDAIAVGEDLEFQERWWTFETAVWWFFVLVLIADALGAFGAGWLAHTRIDEPGVGMEVRYDRVMRAGTPSTVAVQFGADAAQPDGKQKLYVSDTLTKDFGAQRVIPQPETSAVGNAGLTYTFPAAGAPGEVDFELEPSSPGVHAFTLQVPGKPAVTRRIVVMP